MNLKIMVAKGLYYDNATTMSENKSSVTAKTKHLNYKLFITICNWTKKANPNTRTKRTCLPY